MKERGDREAMVESSLPTLQGDGRVVEDTFTQLAKEPFALRTDQSGAHLAAAAAAPPKSLPATKRGSGGAR